MAAVPLPPKPQIGEEVTFRFFGNTLAHGTVLKFIVDTPTRWKVEINVERITGVFAQRYTRFLHTALMFEHSSLPDYPRDEKERGGL